MSDDASHEKLMAERMVGRCELFAPIAKGGMASVHLGRWRGTTAFSRLVAVKALHPQFASDPEFVTMFLDEARVVARIRHPNVVSIVDVVDEAGELFIVMDYVEGVTLGQLARALHRTGQRMPAPIVNRIMSGALQGLHAAHEARGADGEPLGVIHRDISPDNILVGTDGYARVIDFGIARARGRATKTQTGIIKGKMAYLAPEQLLERPLTRRTDIYGAAVVMWQAIAGRSLFASNSVGDTALRILQMPVPRPGQVAEGIDIALDDVVMKGLTREPDARWETAAAMAEAIEATRELASHRAVGQWVRTVASDDLERARAVRTAVESAPSLPLDQARRITHVPPEVLNLPLLSRTGEHELSRTDVSGAASVEDRRPPTPREIALGLLAAVALAVSGITVAQVGEPPSGSGASTAPASIVVEPEPAHAAPLETASASSSAATEPSAAPTASARVAPPRRAPRPRPPAPFRVPADI